MTARLPIGEVSHGSIRVDLASHSPRRVYPLQLTCRRTLDLVATGQFRKYDFERVTDSPACVADLRRLQTSASVKVRRPRDMPTAWALACVAPVS
jgi:hypothetical protein